MNVMISDITDDLDTTVGGVQATITLFLLTMAILMYVVAVRVLAVLAFGGLAAAFRLPRTPAARA